MQKRAKKQRKQGNEPQHKLADGASPLLVEEIDHGVDRP